MLCISKQREEFRIYILSWSCNLDPSTNEEENANQKSTNEDNEWKMKTANQGQRMKTTNENENNKWKPTDEDNEWNIQIYQDEEQQMKTWMKNLKIQ